MFVDSPYRVNLLSSQMYLSARDDRSVYARNVRTTRRTCNDILRLKRRRLVLSGGERDLFDKRPWPLWRCQTGGGDGGGAGTRLCGRWDWLQRTGRHASGDKLVHRKRTPHVRCVRMHQFLRDPLQSRHLPSRNNFNDRTNLTMYNYLFLRLPYDVARRQCWQNRILGTPEIVECVRQNCSVTLERKGSDVVIFRRCAFLSTTTQTKMADFYPDF